jgi:hypothetical protein
MAADPLKAPASLAYFPAAHSSGPRQASQIKIIVLHSTEGDTAAGAASWFHNPASGASTQIVCDDKIVYRCVADLVIPWAAPGANHQGLHIEHAGYAKWNWAKWMTHRNMLKRSAYQAARWCKRYSIPPVWLSPDDLKAGKKGFTSHLNCTLAFPGGSHTDPGPGFPRWYYLRLVKGYLKGL